MHIILATVNTNSLRKFSEYIRKIGPDRWRVFSKNKRNLGTFSNLQLAQKRIHQIQWFKTHRKKVTTPSPVSHIGA